MLKKGILFINISLIFVLVLIFILYKINNKGSNELTILNKYDEMEYRRVNFPNEIQDYYKELIETGNIKPLYFLKEIDKEKYDYIIKHISDKNSIKDYYYLIEYLIKVL